MSNPKLPGFRSFEKTTIESDSSLHDYPLISSKERNIEIEKYFFIKEIIEEVQKQKFLKSSEQLAFKYYMLKMLQCQFGKALQTGSKGEFEKDIDNLISSLQKYTSQMNLYIAKIIIPKFQAQLYDPNTKSFNEFKQPYRLVIGHVFVKALKNITQDIHIRSQLKLKLFICHVLNRVFNNQHNEGIFLHFETYMKKQNMKDKTVSKSFSFRSFSQWIENEKSQKLVETVELMNGKFYKVK